MNPRLVLRLPQTPSTVASRLSLYSDSCFFPDDLMLHHFICKKIPFPCTMILLFGGLTPGLVLSSKNLRSNFQLVCGFGRAA